MEDLIDQIYEAAAVPSLWSGDGVLEQVARLADCSDAFMIATKSGGINGCTANTTSSPKLDVYLRDGWIKQNPYLQTWERRTRFAEPRFLMDTEVMSAMEMAESSYYQGFMRPYGVYWHAGTSIASSSGDSIKLSVHRSFDRGPLDPSATRLLNQVRPHLARASFLTARLRFEQVHAAVEAFSLIGLACAGVRQGRLTVANTTFQALIPEVVQDRIDRLHFVHQGAEACWLPLISGPSTKGRTFQIAASPGHVARIVHVLPLVGASRDIFAVADTLLVVVDMVNTTEVDGNALLGLYDLTFAESEITQHLALGRSLKEIAAVRGVTVATVRNQLKNIFEKTGTHRQLELVQLVLARELKKGVYKDN